MDRRFVGKNGQASLLDLLMKLYSTAIYPSLKWLGVVLAAAMQPSMAAPAPAERPNIIFILADDLGWSDTSLYGTTKLYQTPHLQRLASRGMLFSRAYSASPLCSPTRASILSGKNPARLGLTEPNCHGPNIKLQATLQKAAPPHQKALMCEGVTRFDTKHFSLAKALKQAGYATAHFGKWHLGAPPHSPLEHGFDIDIPHWPGPGPGGSFVAPWKFPDFDPNTPNEHIEDRMAHEAVAFMEKHRDQPFFLNYWMFSVHAPFDAKKSLVEKYRSKLNPADPQQSPTYAAMVESMDDAVGTLLDAVDRLGIAEKTAVIFISDNGGNMYDTVDGTTPTSNSPLRGGKATVYEGGTRVPCIIAWPKQTEAGSRSAALIQTTDFYPTFLSLLQLKPNPKQVFDGIDISPAFASKPLPRKALFTYFPHSPPIVPDHLPPAITVTSENWKLIRIFHHGDQGAHAYQLYDLKNDLGERRNLAEKQPERVKALDAMIENFLVRTNTLRPKKNPRYDPAAPIPPSPNTAKAAAIQ
jgi:arylsulfatase A-like enzyme